MTQFPTQEERENIFYFKKQKALHIERNTFKYTICGFQQKILLELGLDGIDAHMLRWVVDFKDSGKMVKIIRDEKEYFWVRYSYICKAIPVLGIENNEVIARRFRHYVKCGLMFSYTKRSGGTFTYYRFNEEVYLKLIENPEKQNDSKVGKGDYGGTKTTQKSGQNDFKVDEPPDQNDSKVEPKDSSGINNSSVKESIYCQIVSFLNEKTGKKFSGKSTSTKRLIRARLNDGFHYNDFLKVIDNKVCTWLNDPKMNEYLRPITLFGTKFESYLNSKPAQSNDPNQGILL